MSTLFTTLGGLEPEDKAVLFNKTTFLQLSISSMKCRTKNHNGHVNKAHISGGGGGGRGGTYLESRLTKYQSGDILLTLTKNRKFLRKCIYPHLYLYPVKLKH